MGNVTGSPFTSLRRLTDGRVTCLAFLLLPTSCLSFSCLKAVIPRGAAMIKEKHGDNVLERHCNRKRSDESNICSTFNAEAL
ncbi:hypothetical protein CDAR_571841 [Caerostris darwini]|uniref:Secreted protein n=1 Tax=Caerostris darwini TaxID=1538125 RepID=A0AAV4PRC2_9ARAC|nr:hypothetical protein CDAR_571841 [Caerostris darwini]